MQGSGLSVSVDFQFLNMVVKFGVGNEDESENSLFKTF